jgi:hypothetical protein
LRVQRRELLAQALELTLVFCVDVCLVGQDVGHYGLLLPVWPRLEEIREGELAAHGVGLLHGPS